VALSSSSLEGTIICAHYSVKAGGKRHEKAVYFKHDGVAVLDIRVGMIPRRKNSRQASVPPLADSKGTAGRFNDNLHHNRNMLLMFEPLATGQLFLARSYHAGQ
jgi:hypothetical protein